MCPLVSLCKNLFGTDTQGRTLSRQVCMYVRNLTEPDDWTCCISLLALCKVFWNPTCPSNTVSIQCSNFCKSNRYKVIPHSYFHLCFSDYNISKHLIMLVSLGGFLSVNHLFVSFANFHWGFCLFLVDLQEVLVYSPIGQRKISSPRQSAVC